MLAMLENEPATTYCESCGSPCAYVGPGADSYCSGCLKNPWWVDAPEQEPIVSELSDNDLRAEYAAIRKRAMGERFCPPRGYTGTLNQEFDKAVKAHLAEKGATNPTPAQWVWAAKYLPCRCGRCAGTGQFITRVENGKPKGPGGQCFRCNGKGYQTDDDARRNYGYDVYGVKIYF